MAVMHAHGIVHADLKPENILLRKPVQEGNNDCPEVVITDFGSAFSTSETDTSRVACEMQTLPYRAPEVCYLPPAYQTQHRAPRCQAAEEALCWAIIIKSTVYT